MLLDSNLQFDPAGSAVTVTRDSTNIIDTAIVGPSIGGGSDIGIGHPLKLLILTDTQFAAAGAATMQISLSAAPDNGSGAPGTYVILAESAPLSLAQLNFGNFKFPIDMPPSDALDGAIPRFYKLTYTVGTGPFTAGALEAWLVEGRDDNVAYPSGFSVAALGA